MTTESVTTPSLSPVPFHGQTLFVTEINGQPYTPMRPIVEGMGLAWKPQFTKIKSRAERWGVTMMVTPSEGGEQTTLCLPLRKLPGWLMTINPSKVAPSLRGNVVLYQTECDDALWDFWTKGQATNKRMVEAEAAAPKQIDPCTETLLTPISRQVLSEDVRHGVALIAAKTGNEGSSYLERKRFYQLAACNVGAGNATRMTNNEVAKVLPLVRQQIEGALGEKIDWREISADGRFVIERLVVTAPAGVRRPETTRPEPEQVRLDPIDNTVKDLIDEVIESLHRTGKNNDEYLYGIERDVESLVKTMTAKISTADLPAMERRATLDLLAETARAFREQTHLMMIARNAISPILRTMTHIAWIADSRRSIQDAKVALPAGRGRPRKALAR